MSEWVVFVNVGTTPEAVYGPIWALAEEYGIKPSAVYLVYTEGSSRFLETVKRAVRVVLGKGVRFYEILVDEADIDKFVETVARHISGRKGEGRRVVVDITAGRKTMSVAAYKAALEAGADLITYLHLRDRAYEGWPYPLVPKALSKLVTLYGGV